jgi:hypothetical protein
LIREDVNMFIDIALKAIVVQLVYAAVLIVIDKIGAKNRKNKNGEGEK